MKLRGTAIILFTILVFVSTSAFADDTGERDTIRLEGSGTWNILDFADSLYTFEMFGYAEWLDASSQVEASSIPFRLFISGPDYDPAVHDSFIVIDTFVRDPAWVDQFDAPYKRFVVWDEFDEYEANTVDTTFNAFFCGSTKVLAPIFTEDQVTRMGEYTLKIRHPDKLPDNFTIEVDSSFLPPAGVFKFSIAGGAGGHAPYFEPLFIDVDNTVLDAADDGGGVGIRPRSYSMDQNYPNPFNPNTTIKFYNETKGRVTIDIYNLLGQRVKTLVDQEMEIGEQEVVWDGNDERGKPVSSGIYFYKMTAGTFHDIKKMLLLK